MCIGLSHRTTASKEIVLLSSDSWSSVDEGWGWRRSRRTFHSNKSPLTWSHHTPEKFQAQITTQAEDVKVTVDYQVYEFTP